MAGSTVPISIALARAGVARAVRRLLPYMSRAAGVLLVLSGGYLSYYWWRIQFGDSATLADDPLVGRIGLWSAQLQAFAARHDSAVLAAAAVVVAIALLSVAWQLARRRRTLPTVGAARE